MAAYQAISFLSYLLLEGFCAIVVAVMGLASRSYFNTVRQKNYPSLIIATIAYILFLLADMGWNSYVYYDVKNHFLFYFVNGIYFISLLIGSISWLIYTIQRLEFTKFDRPIFLILLMIPALFAILMVVLTPFTHWLYYMDAEGEYIRSNFFHLFSVVNYGDIVFAGLLSLSNYLKCRKNHSQNKTISLVMFCYIMGNAVGGLLQVTTGYNISPLGCTISLTFYFTYLIVENNIDKLRIMKFSQQSDQLISILASDFIVVDNVRLGRTMEEDTYRNIRSSEELSAIIPHWDNSVTYHDRVLGILEYLVLPENRELVHTLTKRDYLLRKMNDGETVSVNFIGASANDSVYYQMKFVPEVINGKMIGFISGIKNVDDEVRREKDTQMSLEHMITERTMELQQKNRFLNTLNEKIIELLGNIVEGRDQASGEHIRRVKGFTYILAEAVMVDCPEYHLTKEDVELIAAASPLHDLGKIAIPDAILNKPGKLTPEEFEVIKTHTTHGMEILQKAPREWSQIYLKTSMDIALCHHEKYDGKGYPNGLVGDEIPISAQIVSIADCYDALTTRRVYKDAYGYDEAYQMILNGECGVFSDKLLDCFKKVKNSFEVHAKNPELHYETASFMDYGRNSLFDTTILLVDDNELDREMTGEILKREGAEVVMASSGYEAIDMVKHAEPYSYDAVLMDVTMEGLDGVATTISIRNMQSEWTDFVPIIALTALSSEESIRQGVEAGMNGYLTKPISVPVLTRKLIDSMRSQRKLLQEKLNVVEKRSNKDPLTGVKNISAYTDMVSSLSQAIKNNPKINFAVVEVDINDLKRVNDSYGHDIGDIYIKNCANILCECFKHSPVYRIGGDEFVIILQNGDYQLRDKLIMKLQGMYDEASRKNTIENGKASFAAGIAEYSVGIDQTVGDVVKKADTSMYHNKSLMKRDYKKTSR